MNRLQQIVNRTSARVSARARICTVNKSNQRNQRRKNPLIKYESKKHVPKSNHSQWAFTPAVCATLSDFVTDTSLTSWSSVAVAGLASAPMFWAVNNYHVCKPNQYLVRTGLGISDISVTKSGIRWPFQNAMMVDVNPTTYTFRLHMSKGKVEFELPVVMTIGPCLSDDDPDSFSRYCKLLQDMTSSEIESTVKGIIVRAQFTVEELYNAKENIREKFEEKLAPDLKKLGLRIYNAEYSKKQIIQYSQHILLIS